MLAEFVKRVALKMLHLMIGYHVIDRATKNLQFIFQDLVNPKEMTNFNRTSAFGRAVLAVVAQENGVLLSR